MEQPPPYETAIIKPRQQPSNVAPIYDSPYEVTENVYTNLAPDATRMDSIEMRSPGESSVNDGEKRKSSTKCSKRACCIVAIFILVILAAGGYGVFFILNHEKGAAIICPYAGENDTASISFSRPSISYFDNEVSISYTLQTGDVLAIFPFSKSIHTLHNMEEGVNVITATGSDGSKTASCDFTYVRIPVNENSDELQITCPYPGDNTTSSITFPIPTVKNYDNIEDLSIQYTQQTGEIIGVFPASEPTHTLQDMEEGVNAITATAFDGRTGSASCVFTYFREGSAAWSTWGSWDSCTETCCGGLQSRTRSCLSDEGESDDCIGSDRESQICNTNQCPVWSAWGSWDSCSQTCCGGLRSRTRSCSSCGFPSNDCSGSGSDTQACNTQQCPVWSVWGSLGSCSQTCCGGQQSRTRSCISCGSPSNECSGGSSVTQECNPQQCPVWSVWGSWDSCSKTCCGGHQSRTRSCSSCGSSSNDCSGSGSVTQACNTQQCPVWSVWGSWGSCSQTCCGGQQSRTRSCSSCGSSSNDCSGSGSVTQACNTQQCPEWTTWGGWGQCIGWIAECEPGLKTRTRMCLSCGSTSNICIGSATDTDSCLTRCTRQPCC